MNFLFVLCFLSINFFAHAEITKNSQIQEVLSYWFGNLKSATDYPQDKSRIWFNGGAKVDQEIKERFEPLVIKAGNHQLDDWKNTPRGRLALIILVDQFTRNIYRNNPKAFAFDNVAQGLTIEGIKLGDDKKIYPIERAFFYLPLEHAENLKLQEMSVAKFEELSNSAPETLRKNFESNKNYAVKHYEIIKKFGRFPHRNKILGRESTPEEEEFLKKPGSSF